LQFIFNNHLTNCGFNAINLFFFVTLITTKLRNLPQKSSWRSTIDFKCHFLTILIIIQPEWPWQREKRFIKLMSEQTGAPWNEPATLHIHVLLSKPHIYSFTWCSHFYCFHFEKELLKNINWGNKPAKMLNVC
jgi:hypothetical protein